MKEMFNLIGNKRIYQQEDVIEIKDLSGDILANSPDISSWNLTRTFNTARNSKNNMKNCDLETILFDIFPKAAKEYKNNNEYDKLMALSRGNPISNVIESKNMIVNMLNNFNLILDENFSIRDSHFDGRVSRKDYTIDYKPIGVVGIISSSTTPEVTPYAALSALSTGNSIIIKADSKEPFSAIEFGKNLVRSGIPEDSVSVITANVKNKPDLGYRLKNNTDKLIIFGSDDNIRKISYYNLKGILIPKDLSNLPLPSNIIGFGTGRSKTVIDADADIKKAAEDTLKSAVELPSLCLKTQFAIVDSSIYDSFVEECYNVVSRMKTGNLLDKNTEVGHVHPEYLDTANSMIKNAINLGGKFVFGNYINEPMTEPIVIKDLALESQIIKEECYAPVLGLIPSSNIDEALNILIKSVDHTSDKKSLKISYFGNSKNNYNLLKNARGIELSKNKKTTDVNPLLPHQGIYLAKELSTPVISEK